MDRNVLLHVVSNVYVSVCNQFISFSKAIHLNAVLIWKNHNLYFLFYRKQPGSCLELDVSDDSQVVSLILKSSSCIWLVSQHHSFFYVFV